MGSNEASTEQLQDLVSATPWPLMLSPPGQQLVTGANQERGDENFCSWRSQQQAQTHELQDSCCFVRLSSSCKWFVSVICHHFFAVCKMQIDFPSWQLAVSIRPTNMTLRPSQSKPTRLHCCHTDETKLSDDRHRSSMRASRSSPCRVLLRTKSCWVKR